MMMMMFCFGFNQFLSVFFSLLRTPEDDAMRLHLKTDLFSGIEITTKQSLSKRIRLSKTILAGLGLDDE